MKDLKKEESRGLNFNAIRIRIASPEKIRSWSHGEVKKAETINYRTFKPEPEGLFCEKIFGPTKDWECSCGRLKRIKYRGMVCDYCKVEVTQSKVRRERMGHIELAVPVSHIWFLKSVPSRMGYLLDMSVRKLEKVIYYENYIVINPKKTPLKKGEFLTEEEYRNYLEKYGNSFVVKMGADAIRDLLKELDLDELARQLRKEMKSNCSTQRKKDVVKRLRVVEAFRKSGNRPEWMILDVIPVLPPELRPLVALDGGRFATSDLNDLYRRVINRNNRLKRLIELQAPDIIIRNEKRMLQEAVDALFDNGRRGRVVRGTNNRPLKSLSDMLKGKEGRFRQNLLGKRVDYSGRSVIVVGPELKLHQCGLPKRMALELFKPFIIKKLEDYGFVHTIKSAKKMVERAKPEVWDILEEVIREHPVLLNRAPTLHRLGIQAFEPALVEGKAIKIHPLVCTAFNADFDGDQMAVHVPLSAEAQIEARILMLSSNNVLSPAHGKPLVTPTEDIVLGICYLTKEKAGEFGEGKIFASSEEAIYAYETGQVNLNARVKVRIKGQLLQTTVGRVIFNEVLPKEFPYLNREINKKEMARLVAQCYKELGNHKTVTMLDKLKKLGFEGATLAGISICIEDMKIPTRKREIIEKAHQEVNLTEEQYQKGMITEGERYNKLIDIWTHATEEVADVLFKELEFGESSVPAKSTTGVSHTRWARANKFNPIYLMADSGARGSRIQVGQLAGMRGLMAKPSGEIIESPIISNFREGLNVVEYFISTHGARKGLADTALKTADAGYLTRRLVDVAQDVIVFEEDCGTVNGIRVEAIQEGNEIIEPLQERIIGRVALDNIVNPITDEVIVRANEEIDEKVAEKIEEAGIEKVRIRSVLTCESRQGVCSKCYGRNLASGNIVELGEAVGIIAAQSIGEPGTQLTMRTFHIGGTASRIVEQSMIEAKNSGKVCFHNLMAVKNRHGQLVVINRNGEISVIDDRGRETERYTVPYAATVKLADGEKIERGEILVRWDPYSSVILSEVDGVVNFADIVEGVTVREEYDEFTGLTGRVIIESKEEKLRPQIIVQMDGKSAVYYSLPAGAHLAVNDGDRVIAGDILVKIPREITKTKDITGGLPRVAELFEARKPKDHAIITEIDGMVEFRGSVKGQRKIIIRNEVDESTREYIIPHGRHLTVREGDRVTAGQPLTEGPVDPHDILRIKGDKELQEYLLNEIQEVYRLQGVDINDKHIEIIIRQMLRKVKIETVGETNFLVGELVDKFRFQEENTRVIAGGKEPATAKPTLLGVTKAALSTDSFISAASFQETTRVLTEAAVSGKIDELRGLKENVIMGHLIPAGTGMSYYRAVQLVSNTTEEVLVGEKSDV